MHHRVSRLLLALATSCGGICGADVGPDAGLSEPAGPPRRAVSRPAGPPMHWAACSPTS